MFKSYDDALAFSKANLDAFVQSSTKFATGVEEVTKEVFGFAGKSFETAVESSKAVAACKTPAEAIALQQKVAKESWDAVVAESTKLSEMGQVIAKSAAEPIQARFKAAMDVAKA